jgi:UV excision repair protein RAD23
MSMKLTIKTLKQISYTVEVQAEALVSNLKEEIEKSHGLDSKSIKLLYNGVVLDDKKSLSEIGVKDGHVIMMMNCKAKPQNQNQSIKEEIKEEEALPTKIPSKQVKETSNVPKSPKLKDYSNEIQTLKEMGFSQEMSKNAINAAKGNVNLAIEFLYNGIPSVNEGPQLSEFYDEDEEGELEPIELDPEMLSNLDLTNPNTLKTIVSVIKVIIQEDPNQLAELLEGIEETNPELIDYIKQNETEFKSLLEQPVNEEDIRVFESLGGIQPVSHNEEGDDDFSDPDNNQVESQLNNNLVQLSQNDKEAVDRLKALGFNEAEALQAYLACEKNETLAANLLFDNKYKDGDMNVDCNFF